VWTGCHWLRIWTSSRLLQRFGAFVVTVKSSWVVCQYGSSFHSYILKLLMEDSWTGRLPVFPYELMKGD